MWKCAFLSRAMVIIGSGIVSLSLIGCSGAPAPLPPQSMPTSVSKPAGPAPAPVQTQVANAAPGAPKPKSKSKPTEKKFVIPPEADPKSVFAISTIGQPMVIMGDLGVLPSEQFEVLFANTKSNSTMFDVDSIKSSQSLPLIGQGQSKAGFTLPKGFMSVKELGYSAEGLPMRILCEKTGSLLALVSAGTSVVGTDNGPDECEPSFRVQLDNFYMEILEVTVSDYDKFKTEMKEKKKPTPPAPLNPSSSAMTPVLGITWAGAQSYARWAGMELPTEAEFEKAARGPNGLRTPWGDGKPLWGNRKLTTTGSYPADSSPYGILDLAGNAKEWCTDLYGPTAHAEAVASNVKDALHNWSGPKKVRDMNLRVVKGNGKDWSAWTREGKDVAKPHSDVGFRCVLRVSLEAKATSSTSKSGM